MSDLEKAQALHREGRLSEARAAYEAIVSNHPVAADALHLLAIVLHQQGELAAARSCAERACAIEARQPHFRYFAGYLASEQGEYEAACEHFQCALVLRPDWATAYRSLGEAWLQRGRPSEAEAAFRRADALRPGDAGLLVALAAALQESARSDEARQLCDEVARMQPSSADVNAQLARLAELRGDHAAAVDRLEACLRADPLHPQGLLLRSTVLRRYRDPLAGTAHERAATALPQNAAAQAALGDFLWESGEVERACASFRRAESLDPTSFRTAAGARLLLPPVYRSADDLVEKRHAYGVGLAELEAVADRFCHRRPGGLADTSWTNFYLAYQGHDDLSLQSRFGDLLCRVVDARAPVRARLRASPPPRERMRVGFLSHFFFNCTAGRYFSSWITDLDPAKYEKIVFYTNHVSSSDTEVIAKSAERFHRVSGRSIERVAALVVEEQLDVLIYPELGMHADTFSLAALRLAPIQLAGWGHPCTPGLPTLDGYLSCAEMEGQDAQAHYRERLYLLPGLGTRYRQPTLPNAKSRRDLGLPESATLYLCPQSLFKIHPDNDALFAQVLAADPLGHLVFFQGRNEAVTRAFEQRLMGNLAQVGVQGSSRVSFLGYRPHADFLCVNAVSDVMLDTRHWSGGNTSLDAIAMGLPMVTLPGKLMRSRQSAAMLRRTGLDELVVSDPESYVREAVRLATDREWREHCRRRLAQGASALFDDPTPVQALASLLDRLHQGADSPAVSL